MAKDKSKTGIPNKHLHARISFLQQAATYLTVQSQSRTATSSSSLPENRREGSEIVSENRTAEDTNGQGITTTVDVKKQDEKAISNSQGGGLPRYLCSHLNQVARKSQIRLHPNIKHSICKRCSTILVEGSTCQKSIENLSKGGKKLHADVLVVECKVCGAKKRWPVGPQRQRRKGERSAAEMNGEDSSNVLAGEHLDEGKSMMQG